MKRIAGLERYTEKARHYAYVEARNKGFSHADAVKNPDCIRFMIQRAQLYMDLTNGSPRLRSAPRSTTVRPPEPVSGDPAETSADPYSRLQALGTVRGLFVAPSPTSGFKVTLKITIEGRGPCYRYGVIQSLDMLPDVLTVWLDKGIWTQDRQETREK